jgi:general secretion pathway protein G
MNPDKTRKNLRSAQSGFSLIEVLVAVTIIALMAGVVAMNVFDEFFRSQRDKARIEISVLKEAVNMYMLREHKLPNDSDWPGFLFNGSKNHSSPYIDTDNFPEEQVNDPWDNPYVYKRISGKKFEIVSYGADGAPGGEEDDKDISSKSEKR